MAHTLHVHSQESLYQNFKKTVTDSDQCLIHPNIEKLYLHQSSTVSHKEIEQALSQWRIQSIQNIEAHLRKNSYSLFEPIVRKDLLAKELFQLFLDIGFEKNCLQVLPKEKFEIYEDILFHSIKTVTFDFLQKNEPLHIIGYSFDKHYLSFFHHAFQGYNVNLWLVNHHAYPQWIDASNEVKKFYFKPLNQMVYENRLACFNFLYSILAQTPSDTKIGVVINQQQQRNWFVSQCSLRSVDIENADGFEGDQFSLMAGSLSQLASFAFDTIYIVDFWFDQIESSSLWSHEEKNKLHASSKLHHENYYNHMLVDTLSGQTQAMYFLFDRTKKVPSLFFHPDEHADPVTSPEITYNYELKDFKKTLTKHHQFISAATWPKEEVHFLPQEASLRLSPTSLSQLSKCPRQYYFRHKMRAKESVDQDQVFKQSPRDFGIMMHEFLQNFFESTDFVQNFESIFSHLQSTSIEKYQKRLPQSYQNVWKLEMQPYFDGLKRYLEKEFTSGWTIQNVEYRWEDDGKSFTDIFANPELSITWTGQVDRIDKNESGLRLIDYKTGNVVKKKTDLFEDGKFIQMPLYLHYMAQKEDVKNVQAEIHQITPTGIYEKAHLTLEEYEKQKEILSKLVNKWISLAQSNLYHPDPGIHFQNCRSCSYVELCGAYLADSLENKESK